MEIAAVIFDLDNTLLNRKLAFEDYAKRLVDTFSIDLDQAAKEEAIQTIIQADRNGYRKKKELYEELLTQLQWKKELTVEELLNYWFSQFYQCSVLMDGALDVIHALKERGVKLGIITNGSVHSQNAKIDYVGLRQQFDVIVVSDEVGVKKPDKGIFELALQKLGVDADSSIYIGDHPHNDIKGASQAGLTTIWLEGFQAWDVTDIQPHYTIRELREMIDILTQA